MTQHDLAVRLLAKAAQDELVVDKLLGDADISHTILGFHRRKAAEKILKAVLAEKGTTFRRSHDLEYLNEELDTLGLQLPGDLEELAGLNPFAVQSRYDWLAPDSSSALDLVEVRSRIRQLREWAEAIVST